MYRSIRGVTVHTEDTSATELWLPDWSLEIVYILVTFLLMMPWGAASASWMDGGRQLGGSLLFLHHHFASCDQSKGFALVWWFWCSGFFLTEQIFRLRQNICTLFLQQVQGSLLFSWDWFAVFTLMCLLLSGLTASFLQIRAEHVVSPDERGTFMYGPDRWTSTQVFHTVWFISFDFMMMWNKEALSLRVDHKGTVHLLRI